MAAGNIQDDGESVIEEKAMRLLLYHCNNWVKATFKNCLAPTGCACSNDTKRHLMQNRMPDI